MEFDVLIWNGTIIDGTGKTPGFVADLGITGDEISAIGHLGDSTAGLEIDARGQAVSPGFIDVHVHSEIALISAGNPHRHGAVQQGITTHLLAPDGFGWAPLDDARRHALWQYTSFAHGEADLGPAWPTAESYLRLFAGNTPANVVPQVPHLAIRMAVMGWDDRAATPAEIQAMKPLVQEWLDAGAVAFNTGLDYFPAASSDLTELVELAKMAAGEGALFAAHLRYSELGREGAWRECFNLAEHAGIPVHVSHEHADAVTGPLLAEAEARCDLTFESYMYPAGCTHLAMMLPLRAQAGGPEAVIHRLADPKVRRNLAADLDKRLTGPDRPAKLVVAANQSGRHIGESLSDLAAAAGVPIGEFAIQMLIEEHPYALMVFHQIIDGDARQTRTRDTIRHPRMMVASDGMYHGQSAHPRGAGCFARVLRHCARELNAVTLEEAVHKMSGFPAQRFGIPRRGVLRESFAADVVIFDPKTVSDEATWDDPWHEPIGISAVLVNGQLVVKDGAPTGLLPGKVVRRGT